jgi:hypothetical protein
MAAARDPGLTLTWRLATLGFDVVAVVAGIAALARWSPSAWILVTALGAMVAIHVGVGAIAYRRTMRRPWPAVRPLADDDDW